MKVKVFAIEARYFGRISDTGSKLEHEINDWLAQRPSVRVVKITQSSSGGSLEPAKIVVSLWYEDA